MNGAFSVAVTAAVFGVSMAGRKVVLAKRDARDADFRAAHDLDDPRSRNELWLARQERRVLLPIAKAAAVVAVLEGIVGVFQQLHVGS